MSQAANTGSQKEIVKDLGKPEHNAIDTAVRLPHKKDRYNGIIVNTLDVADITAHDFQTRLESSLLYWQQAGNRAVWIVIGIEQSELVPVAAKLGFCFHHAKPNYVMMLRWLPENESCQVPSYAFHYIGVAGLVVNTKNQLLVIKEKYHDSPMWKLPGGLAETGEELWQTAEREVLEETGVKAHFVSVLAIRHCHSYMFQCSDMYWVCVMKPESSAIRKCEQEIADCQWMDLETFITIQDVHPFNKHIAHCYKDSLNNATAMKPDMLKHYKWPIYRVR